MLLFCFNFTIGLGAKLVEKKTSSSSRIYNRNVRKGLLLDLKFKRFNCNPKTHTKMIFKAAKHKQNKKVGV